MRLLPVRRPTIGVSIGSKALSLVEVSRNWRPGRTGRWLARSLHRCTEQPVPPGLIRPSSTEPNVSDSAALARELATLVDGTRKVARPASIALILPDLCARVALFEFESLPHKPAEREQLIRWRFHKELNVPAGDVRLTYRVLRGPHPGLLPSGEKAASLPVRLLAVVIRRAIIEQYEQACQAAGFIPVSVNLASFGLFDLYRPVMESAIKDGEECFFLHAGGDCLSFVAIRSGLPVFFRTKALRNGSANGNGEAVMQELLATLQFYQDSHAGRSTQTPTPLFVLGSRAAFSLPDSMGVHMVPLGWEQAGISTDDAPASFPITGLPALAAVQGA